jgi:hypothetical protein
MDAYRRSWYHIGGILFVALAYFMGFWGGRFSHIQVILIYSFMAMLAHQFEEYACPGGLPAIANIVMSGEREAPDRYPLNANQVLISNVFLTYPFYVIPIFFPDLIWLGLIQIGQGLAQVPLHGIVANVILKSPYNPGMLSCLLLQLPLGLYYIWFVHAQHLATTTDYVIGFVGTLVALVVLWLGPIAIFRSRKSPHPFTEAQMFGFRGEQIRGMLRS